MEAKVTLVLSILELEHLCVLLEFTINAAVEMHESFKEEGDRGKVEEMYTYARIGERFLGKLDPSAYMKIKSHIIGQMLE